MGGFLVIVVILSFIVTTVKKDKDRETAIIYEIHKDYERRLERLECWNVDKWVVENLIYQGSFECMSDKEFEDYKRMLRRS